MQGGVGELSPCREGAGELGGLGLGLDLGLELLSSRAVDGVWGPGLQCMVAGPGKLTLNFSCGRC